MLLGKYIFKYHLATIVQIYISRYHNTNPVESETAKPWPLWNIWSNVCQVTEHYYKKLFGAALIAVHVIVKPNTTADIVVTNPTPMDTEPATSSMLTEDDMDTVAKIDTKLTCMEQDWAKT